MKFASSYSRFWASVIDSIIIAIPIYVPIFLVLGRIQHEPLLRYALFTYSTLLPLLFYIYFETCPLQATPGMRYMGIRIYTEDFQKLTRFRSLGRYLFACLITIVLQNVVNSVKITSLLQGFQNLFSAIFISILPVLSIFFSEKKQALYDMVAKVVVVEGEVVKEPISTN